MRLLLLEGDYDLRRSFGRGLRADGHAVDEVRTIAKAEKRLADTPYDCVVLDRLVTDGDATVLIDREGAEGEQHRTLFFVLSGPEGENGRLECLAAGADDVLAKPIDVGELIVRVRRLIIRHTPGGARVQIGSVTIDRARRVVLVEGRPVRLSPLQFSVCEQLAIHVDRVVDKGRLLDHCWDGQRDPFANPLHSQITRLRSIFRGHLVIESARGSGYRMHAPSETSPPSHLGDRQPVADIPDQLEGKGARESGSETTDLGVEVGRSLRAAGLRPASFDQEVPGHDLPRRESKLFEDVELER